MIEGVKCKSLLTIPGEKGSIIKLIQKDEENFPVFGEAYFSTIKQNSIKGWKRHIKMTCNIIVILGVVEFVIHDNRDFSKTNGESDSFLLNHNKFKRLTIPPGLWFGFKGIDEKNIILNISDFIHDDSEVIESEVDNDLFPDFIN